MGKLKALRNILVHEYFRIDCDVLWDIIQNYLPRLRREMQKMLEQEGGG